MAIYLFAWTVQLLTSEQKETLKQLYRSNISLRQELKMSQCQQAINEHACLKDLSWKKIKNTVHNWIIAEKKKTSTYVNKSTP